MWMETSLGEGTYNDRLDVNPVLIGAPLVDVCVALFCRIRGTIAVHADLASFKTVCKSNKALNEDEELDSDQDMGEVGLKARE